MADCPEANTGLIFVRIAVSWLFVLLTLRLAQATNGLTKIFLFWIQSLLVVLSGSHDAFSWYERLSLAHRVGFEYC